MSFGVMTGSGQPGNPWARMHPIPSSRLLRAARRQLRPGERELWRRQLRAGAHGGVPGRAVFLGQDVRGDRVLVAVGPQGRAGPERRAVGTHASRVRQVPLVDPRGRRRRHAGRSAAAAPAARRGQQSDPGQDADRYGAAVMRAHCRSPPRTGTVALGAARSPPRAAAAASVAVHHVFSSCRRRLGRGRCYPQIGVRGGG
jgi:hypothetical protein